MQSRQIDRNNPDIFWIATGGGLHRFDKSTETFTLYRHDPTDPTSLGNDGTYTIVQDGGDPNTLWIGLANGFDMFNINCELIVLNQTSNNKEDLVQDFVSVIKSFCARLYGQRRTKRKTEKIIKELCCEKLELGYTLRKISGSPLTVN